MYRNFNIYSYAVALLPPALRNKVVKFILRVLLKPLEDVVSAFNNMVADVDRRITHNSFTIYMEKFLNDLFGLKGQIYITDYIDRNVYLAKKNEIKYLDTMTMKSEGLPTIVLSSERPQNIQKEFIVYIPIAIDTDDNRKLITRWVNYYKYIGTNFTIEAYE